LNKKIMKKSILITICIVMVSVITIIFAVAGNAAEGDLNKINSVLINKDSTEIAVKGTLTPDYVNAHKNDKIYLFDKDSEAAI